MNKPLVLCILDGCGIREESFGNAFKNANKPTFDYLINTYPNSLLEASGEYVGLPKGQMGNSEVGHMNIGAGRIIYQPLEIINNSIKDNSFYSNHEILETFKHVKDNNSKLHIMGLLSDGGVHSHIDHLFALLKMAKDNNVKNICIHVFLDGRDTNNKSGITYLSKLTTKLEELEIGKIVTVSGRYYAMDRDNNYDRIEKAYNLMCYNSDCKADLIKEINNNYDNNITDEFIEPFKLTNDLVEDNDGIITFNFRPDRLRELFTLFTNPSLCPINYKEFNNLKVLTMFPVTNDVKCNHAFVHSNIENKMGEYLYKKGLRQLRIAETEKYAHVTYFYDGGVEEDYSTMKKILIPSPKVKTFDLKPEMSAREITSSLINELDKDIYDVVILNYANGDMVGHTGDYNAAVKAVEFLDKCLSKLYGKVLSKGGTLIITADHGNCDVMIDNDNKPVTSHTTNKVPFIITDKSIKLKDGKLSDIAPTMLELLGIEKPNEMTGESLIEK